MPDGPAQRLDGHDAALMDWIFRSLVLVSCWMTKVNNVTNNRVYFNLEFGANVINSNISLQLVSVVHTNE